MDQKRFKAQGSHSRSALLTFAQRHPGALTAHFLSQVRERLRGPGQRPTKTSHLRDVSVVDWVGNGSGLSEVRDVREATTLACILDAVNRKCVEEALDVLVMRLHALQAAKGKGGTCEKASKLELIPASSSELLPSGLSGMAS